MCVPYYYVGRCYAPEFQGPLFHEMAMPPIALRHSFQMETTFQTTDNIDERKLTENDVSVACSDNNCIIYYRDWE